MQLAPETALDHHNDLIAVLKSLMITCFCDIYDY